MFAKLIISFVICGLCASSVIVRIRPIKIIKYGDDTSTALTTDNATSRYDASLAAAHSNGTDVEGLQYDGHYTYDDRTENYDDDDDDDDFEVSNDDGYHRPHVLDSTDDTITATTATAAVAEDESGSCAGDWHRCQLPANGDRPVVTAAGATVLNPRHVAASKNASYVVPLYGNATSYSGYLAVNQRYRAYLYFWFFCSESNPSTAPLIVWLQGQPGTSVLVGLFEEHGPYYIDDGSGGGGGGGGMLRPRDFRWTREFNVLYMDHCIPCGFSYAEDEEGGATTTLQASADAVYQALQQFYGVFGEFATNEVYLAGAYGCGKIIPAVCLTIDARNRNRAAAAVAAAIPVNLKGAMIGNALVNVNYMVNYGDVWFHWGLADPRTRRNVGYLEEIVRGYIRADHEEEVLNYFRYHIFVKLSERDYDSPYDVRQVNASMADKEAEYVDERLFRRWLHVGNATYRFGHKYLSMKLLKEANDYLPVLLPRYKFMFYNGQFDPLFTHYQTSKFLNTINWPGLDQWYRSRRQNWYVNDRLLGYSKSHRKLTQVLVRNAGHMVGQTQPETLFYLLKWFVKDMFPDSVELGKYND